jgi:hypothetical protein
MEGEIVITHVTEKLNLATMTEREKAIYLAGYEKGNADKHDYRTYCGILSMLVVTLIAVIFATTKW